MKSKVVDLSLGLWRDVINVTFRSTFKLEQELRRLVGVLSAEHTDLDLVGAGVVDVPEALPAAAHRDGFRAAVLLTDDRVRVTYLAPDRSQLRLK